MHEAPEQIERTVLLDADVADVLAALDRPEVLSAWLGEWTPDAEGDGATVVTDDGTPRRVTDRRATRTTRSWTWSPIHDPAATSVVTFTVTTVAERTRLTVTEHRTASSASAARGASVATAAVRWTGALMALGAVLAVGSPVPA